MVLQEHPSGCVDLHVAVTRGVDLQAEAQHGVHTWQSGASTAEKCSSDCVHAIRGVGRSAQTLYSQMGTGTARVNAFSWFTQV